MSRNMRTTGILISGSGSSGPAVAWQWLWLQARKTCCDNFVINMFHCFDICFKQGRPGPTAAAEQFVAPQPALPRRSSRPGPDAAGPAHPTPGHPVLSGYLLVACPAGQPIAGNSCPNHEAQAPWAWHIFSCFPFGSAAAATVPYKPSADSWPKWQSSACHASVCA